MKAALFIFLLADLMLAPMWITLAGQAQDTIVHDTRAMQAAWAPVAKEIAIIALHPDKIGRVRWVRPAPGRS